MSEQTEWETEAEVNASKFAPEVLASLPPALQTDSQGSAYLVRYFLLGLAFAMLAALSVVQLQWWVTIAMGALWLLGILFFSVLAPLRAKQHRGGVGYPADPAHWAKTYAKIINGGTVFLTLLSLVLAAVALFTQPQADASQTINYTPLILLFIVGVLAVLSMRWLVQNKLLWLIYGGR